MDKQKQIEEMAKTLCANCRKDGYSCSLYSSDDDWVCVQERERAEFFYNAGYRKIPEGSVVLTKERYIEMLDEIKVSQGKLLEMLKTVEKKTAEKFAEKLKAQYPPRTDKRCTLDDCYMLDKIDEICKEITESK